MLKHKREDKFTNFEMASLKQAYLDFYYQLLFSVCSWKKQGHVGNKAHLLLHDLEHSWYKERSPAFVDDQRFENFNQLYKLIRSLYRLYLGHKKLLFVGNRLNNRALSCG